VLEEELQRLGADVLRVEIPADLAQQLEADEEEARAMLAEQVGAALTDSEKKENGS
jgi:hypothetical protein